MANANATCAGTINRTLSDAMVTSMAECFAIQQATLNIPFYDGKNMRVRDFIQDVENGEASVPPNCEMQYIKAVLSRLKGAARDSIHGKEFLTIRALLQHLKQRFATKKSYSWYLHEISTIRMYRTENVSEFHDRITLLISGAKAALRDKYPEADPIIMNPLNDCGLEAFINGLPDNMSGVVQAQTPENLEGALELALKYETRNQNHSFNYHDYRYSRSNYENFRERSPSPQVRFASSPDRKFYSEQNTPGIIKTNDNKEYYYKNKPPPRNQSTLHSYGHNTPPRSQSPTISKSQHLNYNSARRPDAPTSEENTKRQTSVRVLLKREESTKQN